MATSRSTIVCMGTETMRELNYDDKYSLRISAYYRRHSVEEGTTAVIGTEPVLPGRNGRACRLRKPFELPLLHSPQSHEWHVNASYPKQWTESVLHYSPPHLYPQYPSRLPWQVELPRECFFCWPCHVDSIVLRSPLDLEGPTWQMHQAFLRHQ